MASTLLAHHWFFQPRGGERVLVELAALLPDAAILTAFAATDVSDWPTAMAALAPRVRPSRLQGLYRAAAVVPPRTRSMPPPASKSSPLRISSSNRR